MDNDGDGLTDSVWVDLGYPARRNAQGQLYKPLFAFMVIGLNGRIPLNTAGNLAGGGPGNGGDPCSPPGQLGQRDRPDLRAAERVSRSRHRTRTLSSTRSWRTQPWPAHDGQVDNGGADVRLTQLRNLLTGTRPQPNPGTPGYSPGQPGDYLINGDNNFVSDNRQPALLHAQRHRRHRRRGHERHQPAGCRGAPHHSPRGGPVGRVAVGARLPDVTNPNGPPFNLVMSDASTTASAPASRSTSAITTTAPHATSPTTISTRSTPIRRLSTRAGRGRTTSTSSIPPGLSSSPWSGCGGT